MDYDEDVLDLFDSWNDVRAALDDLWVDVSGPRCCVGVRHGSLRLFEGSGSWCARERRAVHRLGFRNEDEERLRFQSAALWSWTPSPATISAEVRARPDTGATQATDRLWVALRMRPEKREALLQRDARQRLLADMAVRLVRDVFHTPLGDVLVTLLVECECMDEEESDDQWSTVTG